DFVDLDPGINQRLGLRVGAGKAVKEKSIDTVILLNSFLYQTNNNLVRNKPTGGHDSLSLLTQLCSSLDCSPEHIAGRNLGNPVFITDKFSLGTFAGTWWTEQNNIHRLLFPVWIWGLEGGKPYTETVLITR